MKIALAHDTFTQQGGAERVVENFHQLFPDAPVFTLVFDPYLREKYKGWDIRTSQLQTLFLAISQLQYLMPIIPTSVDSLTFEGFDLILSSSSSFIKNIRPPKGCVHICYCHTPTRFLWHNQDYINQELPWFLKPFSFLIRWYLKKIKQWDYAGAQRVNYFIANSREVQKRIKEYYQRDSEVIYPGINVGFWMPSKTKESYFLLAGRLQAHKQNDFVIRVFNDLGLPLRVVGTGRNLKYLKSIAKSNITFYEKVTDEQLRDHYSGAKGYIYPQIEDFGLMPLEAAACGTATIAFGKAGALETVLPGKTGEFFYNYDKEELKGIIKLWKVQQYNVAALREHANKFSDTIFKKEIAAYVARCA